MEKEIKCRIDIWKMKNTKIENIATGKMLWIFRTFSSSILVNLSCFYVCTHLSSFICISHMCHHFNSYPILMSLRLSGGQLKRNHIHPPGSAQRCWKGRRRRCWSAGRRGSQPPPSPGGEMATRFLLDIITCDPSFSWWRDSNLLITCDFSRWMVPVRQWR